MGGAADRWESVDKKPAHLGARGGLIRVMRQTAQKGKKTRWGSRFGVLASEKNPASEDAAQDLNFYEASGKTGQKKVVFFNDQAAHIR